MAIDEAEDAFFYPEDEGTRSGRGGRGPRPAPRTRRGSPLPWLLCAFLLAAMAAMLVWVDAPLRMQLQHATQAQQRAMEAVAKLEARATAQAGPVDAAPPAAVAADPAGDDALLWAETQRLALQTALEQAKSTATLQVTRQERAVILQVPMTATFRAPSEACLGVAQEARPMWDNVAHALARTLAADESPYRLTIYVPSREAQAEPSSNHSRRRHRRGQRPPEGLSATQLAASRASGLLTWLHGELAMRPKSSVVASFGPSGTGESTASVELRLERAPG